MMINNPEFIGLCEVSSELNHGYDKCLRNEHIAHYAKLLHAKTMRIWLNTNEVFKVKENDELDFVFDGLINLHNYVSSLKNAGVTRFAVLNWGFVYPFGYKASDRMVVPDPVNEKEMYERFLKLQEKLYFELARNYTEILYFEPTNEPDGPGGINIHRNGFNSANSEPYCYDLDTIENIVLDLCRSATIGIKNANTEAKVVFPGFCNLPYCFDYLDHMYLKIKSSKFPTYSTKCGQIEDFFEVMNWHPYNLKDCDINDYWLSFQEKLHEIMVKHDDGDRPVWFTEIGWSDFKRVDEQHFIAKRYVDFLNTVKEKLNWVDAAMFFRLFTLCNRPENEGEDNFGLVYNEYDWEYPFFPKESFVTLYKYINGNDASLNPLFELSKQNKREIFPYEVIYPTNNQYKVLILGNYISRQLPSENNKWPGGRGLGSSSRENDYLNIIIENILGKHPGSKFTFVNMKEYEKTFYSEDVLNLLKPFLEECPDLVLLNIGDNFGDCSLFDHDISIYYSKLLKLIRNYCKQLVVTNSFSQKESVNEKLKSACNENNIQIIDISKVKSNSTNIFTGKYPNTEYKLLPNDKGHREIASIILNNMKF